MNLQKIEDLIGKYDRGETSRDEERQLKAFFTAEKVPVHLNKYKALFTYYKLAGKEELPLDNFNEKFLTAIGEPKVIAINSNKKKQVVSYHCNSSSNADPVRALLQVWI